ncbi:MAG: DUF2344 domain-containing protein [Firmicutes bacterium]|nr:DUF2344 domain-containing protein [Bacillota bacterium]
MDKLPRYRVEYAKGQPVAYISHLDLAKTLERAARRAGLPLALSGGFNPHPKVSFGSVLPVGITGEHEYLDVELLSELPPQELKARWQEKLPPGLELREVRLVPTNAPALMSVIDCARYHVRVALLTSNTPDEIQTAIQKILAQESLVIERDSKKGVRQVDIRPGILALAGRIDNGRLDLDMLLRTGSQGNVRPEEVIQAIKHYAGLSVQTEGWRITRTGLYIGADKLVSPLELTS